MPELPPSSWIKVLSAVEGARKRPTLYGLTEDQVESMTDEEIEKHVESKFPAPPRPKGSEPGGPLFP